MKVALWLRFAATAVIVIVMLNPNSVHLASWFDQTEACPVSFAEFAYGGLREDMVPMLPNEQWRNVAQIDFLDTLDPINPTRVILTRNSNNRQEVWLRRRNLEGDYPVNQHVIYYPETGTWEAISNQTDNGQISLGKIASTQSGEIWGVAVYSDRSLQAAPLIVRFNDSSRQYEVISVQLPAFEQTSENNHARTQIIWGLDHTLWVFRDHEGIYHFDPPMLAIEWIPHNEDIRYDYIARAIDGSVFFSSGSDANSRYLRSISLFRIDPASHLIERVALPVEEDWPTFAGLFVDSQLQVWLGSTGFRDTNGVWHLLHPDVEASLRQWGDPSFAHPQPTLELSDGRLWYVKDSDMGHGIDGAGWYDPVSNTGCMVTSYPAYVVEDESRQLWLVAGEILYVKPV